MSILQGTVVLDPHTIGGHPTLPLLQGGEETGQMITVCVDCGELRTIIMLVGDRWYCSRCRAQGTTKNTKMFPIS